MEGEEKKKKQTQTIFIVAVALIVLILGYEGWKISSMVSKIKSNAKNEKEVVKRTPSKSDNDAKEESISSSESITNESYNNNTETTPTNSIENVDVSTLTVDSSKVINSEAKGWNYSEMVSSNDNLGLGISANKNNNTAVIEISWFKFHNFSTGYMRKNAQGGTFGDNVQKITVQGFKGHIHSAFISGFGQASGFETAFFIMTDGTVEYVPIQKLYDTCGYLNDATVNSFGMVPNVSGVVKIVTASGNAPYSTGSATTLGIKADGTFYDFQFSLDVNSLTY